MAVTSTSTIFGSITDPPSATDRIALDQLGTLVDALLQEIRTAIRPVLEKRERIAGMAILAEHDHAGLRMRFTQDRSGAYSLVRLRWRHSDVGQNDVRLVALDRLQKRVEIAA